VIQAWEPQWCPALEKGPETALSGPRKSMSEKQPRKRQQTIYTKIWNYLETP